MTEIDNVLFERSGWGGEDSNGGVRLWERGKVIATVWSDGLWHSWSRDGLSQATGHAGDMEQAKMRVEEYRNHG